MATKDPFTDTNSKATYHPIGNGDSAYHNINLNKIQNLSKAEFDLSEATASRKNGDSLSFLHSPKEYNDYMQKKFDKSLNDFDALNLSVFEEDVEKRWKNENDSSSANSSTLSLHIAAYENLIEASNDDIQAKQKHFCSLVEIPRQPKELSCKLTITTIYVVAKEGIVFLDPVLKEIPPARDNKYPTLEVDDHVYHFVKRNKRDTSVRHWKCSKYEMGSKKCNGTFQTYGEEDELRMKANPSGHFKACPGNKVYKLDKAPSISSKQFVQESTTEKLPRKASEKADIQQLLFDPKESSEKEKQHPKEESSRIDKSQGQKRTVRHTSREKKYGSKSAERKMPFDENCAERLKQQTINNSTITIDQSQRIQNKKARSKSH
uniref:Uncharacterized protein n=1 Tax=Panagrolaimus sp. ES5 TaxID=591445 RepID=A0AC34F3Z3_9BILA